MRFVLLNTALVLIFASDIAAQVGGKIDLPMVNKVQNFLDLGKVPDQRMQEILEVQIEFTPSPNHSLRTTLGHWIVGTINLLGYGEALRNGLKTGAFFNQREEYFSSLLDRKLDPVKFGNGQVRKAAAEAFAVWGDRLAGGQSFQTLNGATDLFLKTLDVLEVYGAFRELFEQKRDQWMSVYFEERDGGASDGQAWADVEPALTFRVDKEKLHEYFQTSYRAYTLAGDPIAVKDDLRRILKTLMPWEKSQVYFSNSTWIGFWQPDAKSCENGPYPAQPITIDLSTDLGHVTGTVAGPGIRSVRINGSDTGVDLKLIIEHRGRPAGDMDLHMQGILMSGYLKEAPVPGYCNWKGPFQARLAAIRGVPSP